MAGRAGIPGMWGALPGTPQKTTPREGSRVALKEETNQFLFWRRLTRTGEHLAKLMPTLIAAGARPLNARLQKACADILQGVY
jgi:hypothetical protein